jgi:D-arabinose 1-dehydrogenase-like Zn-dependent alcohol dehydrogenase
VLLLAPLLAMGFCRPCLVVWSRSVVASERLHSWLAIQGAGGLGQSAIQGGETGATLTAQQV